MDIEAVVGGDLLTVASVIPEQYNLKKLWADIRDLCFDQPIKHATEVRFQVMLPWETSYATLKTETDLQDAFNKLREKKYSWAIFIIKTELDELEKDKGDSSLPKDRNEEDESPDAQFKVLLPPEPDVEWVDFDKDKEFALPDLNDESNTVNFAAATLIVQDSYESMAAVGLDDNTHDEELEAEKNIDDMDAGSEENLNQFEVDVLDDALDDYHSGDDSGTESDDNDSADAQEACSKYEQNSGGFEFAADGENIMLKPGQLFKNVDEFRKVVKVFAIKNGFRLKRVKNEKSRVTLCCAVEGCTWRIHASPNWNKRHFQIKTHCSEHTCARNSENYEATSTWIGITFLHLFRANTELPIDVLRSELFRKYGITCCNQRLYRAKNKALEFLGQDHKASYTKLFRYMHAIIASNPGSTVSLDKDWMGGGVSPHFKRFFVFFDANRRGFFGGCRQFVGLDGCFLKGLYKGVLLSAVSIDANYGIYPLAVCVVENENTESWVYFMERLYEQIGCNDGEGLCFMSDRQKGILNALERVFPQALKRYCCRHIYANFKQKFPGLLLRKEFWQACRSANATQFKCHMAELYKISPAAHDWLMGIPVVCWAKHCFPTHTKCSHVTNNMTESFNNWIGNFRAMPILRMLEEIRRKIMTLIHKRQQQVLCWKDELPPIVRRRIMAVREESRSLQVIFGHNQTFEVMEDVSKRTTVDLLSKHCDCREWDVSGLPCKHAVCCIDAMRFNVDDYVHTLLKKTSFKNTYSHQLYPVPDESNWPLLLHDNLLPPMIIKTAGRPQTKRRKEAGEAKNFKRSSSVKCSRCDQWGHNKRGCKEPMRSLNVNKAEMKRRSSKKREESSGSVHCDDGSASRATFAGNISSTQSSVVGPGQVILE